MWQYTPYTVPLLVSTVVSGLLAAMAWRYRPNPGAVSFSVLMVVVTAWTLAYALVLTSVDLSLKLLFSKVMYVGVVLAPVVWLLFVLEYTGRSVRLTRSNLTLVGLLGRVGRRNYLTRRNLGILGVVPLVTLGLVWTNGAHGLIWSDAGLSTAAGFTALEVSYGPWFWVHATYSYLLLLGGSLLLIQLLVRSRHIYRGQTGALLLGTFVPWGANVLYISGFSPFPALDPTPAAFAISGVPIFVALFRYQFLDIIPVAREVARDEVIERMNDGVVVLDRQDRIVDLNPAARGLTGLPASEAIGRPIDDLLPDLSAAIGESGETPVELDVGSRCFDVYAAPLFREFDLLSARLVILRDVTDRKRAEERFSTLIEHSSDVITVMDDEEVIQYASPSVERVLGYAPEELIDENVADYIHRDDRSAVLTGVTDAAGDEEIIVDRAEYRFRHADGSWVWLESVGSNRTQSPAIEGFVINSRDVTERKRYERRLQVLNRVLRHDLRNDINMVLAHADDLLDDHRGPDDVEAKARAIREKGLDIADLSEKARQLEQTLTLDGDDLEPIDIVEVVERQIRAVERDHPDVAVERDLPDRAYVSASGLIDSAIDNLLENAIEHNDADEPEVRVEVSDGPDGLVSISIADNGPGIPVVERAVLQRGEENQLEHSSGLGLWLINWIVTESGGDVRFDANDPRGTVITLRLPRADPGTTTE